MARATSEQKAPDPATREIQRKLADAADAAAKRSGQPNPLRKNFQKVMILAYLKNWFFLEQKT